MVVIYFWKSWYSRVAAFLILLQVQRSLQEDNTALHGTSRPKLRKPSHQKTKLSHVGHAMRYGSVDSVQSHEFGVDFVIFV